MVDLLHQYLDYYPLFAFAALILAGLNLPFSEDILIITGALLCRLDKSLIVLCLLALYFGGIGGDFIAYSLGRMVAKGGHNIKSVNRLMHSRRAEKIDAFLVKWGIPTFIVGRLIPFGVRNVLFMSSGFIKMPFGHFAFRDMLAALISVNVLFWICYIFGESAEKPLHVAGVIFVIFLIASGVGILAGIIAAIVRKLRSRKAKEVGDE